MFLRFFSLVLFLLISSTSHSLQAQSTVDSDSYKGKKHLIGLELLGRGFIFGSVNYEHFLTEEISLGLGFGVLSIQNGEITRSNNGIVERGRYLDSGTSQMLYGNYYLGQKRHQLFVR